MAGKSRVKVTGTVLESWEQVDDAIRRFGLLELQKAEYEAELHRVVTEAKERAAKECAPIEAEMQTLAAALKEFAESRRQDLEPQKSRVLTFGTIGFRLSTKLKFIGAVKDTLDALRRLGMSGCIRVKEEPDREALREYSDEILEAVHMRRVPEDAFFFEPDRERIKELPR